MRKNRWYMLAFLTALNGAAALAWYLALSRFEFNRPIGFWFLALIPLTGLHYFLFQRDQVAPLRFQISRSAWVARAKRANLVSPVLFTLRTAVLWLAAMALARPQARDEYESTHVEGIDIVIALDISESMLALDFSPNRLEVAKERALEFIDGRPDDRIGLVVFQGEAYTQVPLTTDHRVLKNAVIELRPGLLEPGTAVGMGLATALNRIKDSEAVSKIVILLTDGEDNTGQVRPMDAAGLAQALGIRVYTVGIGRKGPVQMPVRKYPNGQYEFGTVENHIDEETLIDIAKETGGKYFHATSSDKLKDVYEEIDALEKTKFEVTQYSKRREEYPFFLLPAVVLLLAELFARLTFFRSMP